VRGGKARGDKENTGAEDWELLWDSCWEIPGPLPRRSGPGRKRSKKHSAELIKGGKSCFRASHDGAGRGGKEKGGEGEVG